MKKTICTCALLLSMATAFSQTVFDGKVTVSNLNVAQGSESLLIGMDIDVSNVKLKSNNEFSITPLITNGSTEKATMPTVRIMGRKRYYYHLRNNDITKNGYDYRVKKVKVVNYSAKLPYEQWMETATIVLEDDSCGCHSKPLGHGEEALMQRTKFIPVFKYVTPIAEAVKSRALEGSAYIDFPVDKTEIYYEYHNNMAELGKIRATIDSVRNDKDITITSVWLKGYASPESPYAHNRDLAIGRTAALKSYIQMLYNFENGIISTEYEPEDWAGLRRYVEKSNLEHRAEILSLIDNYSIDPDKKEAMIKSSYPSEYKFLLENCYPWLRHTDYRISYNIRGYNDVNEIREIMKTQPQKLSLNEFYLLAQNSEPGTEEYTEIFETAVRMYPDDETANLNVANVEMGRNDFTSARKHLNKAGNGAEAEYARGVLAVLETDYAGARKYFEKAKSGGITEADACLEYLDSIQ